MLAQRRESLQQHDRFIIIYQIAASCYNFKISILKANQYISTLLLQPTLFGACLLEQVAIRPRHLSLFVCKAFCSHTVRSMRALLFMAVGSLRMSQDASHVAAVGVEIGVVH